MTTKEIKLYGYEDLIKPENSEILENVLQENSYLNTDYEWYELTYEDAKSIGLKITSFDIYRGDITGSFIFNAFDVADAIISNHGEACETYKTAKEFLDSANPLNDELEKIEEYNSPRGYDLEQEIGDLAEQFEDSLLEDYLIILRKECEYLESEEAILQTIESNDYHFEANGKMNNF